MPRYLAKPALMSAAVLGFLLLAVACTARGAQNAGKPLIVTTLFPQYDFARTLVGDAAEVRLILPPGVEPHAFDPTPRDVADIQKADLFIFTGKYMEPWVERLLPELQAGRPVVVDVSKGIVLLSHDEEHSEGQENDEGEEHHEGDFDPHIWLDPVNAKVMVQTIAAALTAALPARAEQFAAKRDQLLAKLDALHNSMSAFAASAASRTIIYGGHFAFGYFAHRYGFEHASPWEGFAPNAEPSPRRIAELSRILKQSGSKAVYFEELIDPKVARTIAESTGAKLLLLHGAHNVSREELDKGVSYLTLMEGNLQRLQEGLGSIDSHR